MKLNPANLAAPIPYAANRRRISYAEWINCQPYNTADIAQNCAVCAKQNCDINLIIHNGI